MSIHSVCSRLKPFKIENHFAETNYMNFLLNLRILHYSIVTVLSLWAVTSSGEEINIEWKCPSTHSGMKLPAYKNFRLDLAIGLSSEIKSFLSIENNESSYRSGAQKCLQKLIYNTYLKDISTYSKTERKERRRIIGEMLDILDEVEDAGYVDIEPITPGEELLTNSAKNIDDAVNSALGRCKFNIEDGRLLLSNNGYSALREKDRSS